MKLEDWRLDKGYTYRDLARKLDAPGAGVVHRWCLPISNKRRVRPNEEYMRRIKIATNGAVQPNDFFLDLV